MNYNRFLDLHLCTSSSISNLKKKYRHQPGLGDRRFFVHRGVEYFYDFEDSGRSETDPGDVESQLRYRLSTNNGYRGANSKVLRSVEVTRSQKSLLQFKGNAISEELRALRYLGCLVAIEHLKENVEYPQLKALMSWISDATTINKLRINCHGAGTSDSGFLMGTEQLTPLELVQAFVRHGLTRAGRAKVQVRGIAHAARWKLDEEVAACEGCNTAFQKTWYGSSSKHHCRRCGGIFCERCSAHTLDLEVALVGPDKPPAKNVKQARVCTKCFDMVRSSRIASLGLQPAGGVVRVSPNLDQYGLQQITLACCMAAKSDTAYSPERTPEAGLSEAEARVVADSLAGRFVAALRDEGIRGVKVTASNLVVGNTAFGIVNSLDIEYPGMTNKVTLANLQNTFDFMIPAEVWGNDADEKRRWETSNLPVPDSSDITVGLTGRDLEFGRVKDGEPQTNTKLGTLDGFLSKWSFPSWQQQRASCFSATTRRSALWKTIRLTPPPMIQRLELCAATQRPKIKITSLPPGLRLFKWFKSYEVS